MDEIAIRERLPADLDHCVEALAVVHRVDGYPLNWPAHPRQWLCPPGLLQAWVAETATASVVGHVAVHMVTPPPPGDQVAAVATAEVSRLFVVPAARRHALATRLLRQVRQWAADQEFQLVLEVTDDARRSPAVALYERAGWRYTHTSTAGWTTPDGRPVAVRHYVDGP